MGFLATQPPSAPEVKEPPARSKRWKPNHQRLEVRMECRGIIIVAFCPSHSLEVTLGCLLTPSAAKVVYRQRRRFDVRAASVSVGFREEKEPRSSPDRSCQDFTQAGSLARPVTGEVRICKCACASERVFIIVAVSLP